MRSSILRTTVLGLFGSSAALICSPVFAQANDATAASEPAASLEEIIVTAQRREENLQKAAIAVSAVSGDDLIERGVTSVDQLSKVVPALVIQPTGGTGINAYIRGVGAFGATPSNENAIPFAIDGVFIGRPSGTVGNFYDLERVEVLKGPQGTLYGRNSTGGAINVVTRKPVLGDMAGYVNLELGNYSQVKTQAAINLPVGDSVAVRLSGQTVRHDGYLSMGYDDEKGESVRAQMLYKPNEQLSMLVSADYYQQGGNGSGSVLLSDGAVAAAPAADARISGADPASLAVIQAAFPGQYASLYLPTTQGYVDGKFWGVSTTIDYDFGFATLTAIPAYRVNDTSYLSYRPGFHQAQPSEQAKQYSGELRLASPSDQRLAYVTGLYYFDQNQDAETVNRQAAGNQNQVLYDINTRSSAVFGQLTYSVTDTFRLVAGARYTKETKEQDAASRSPTNAAPNPAYAPIVGETSFSKVTWKAGVEYDAAERSLLYANVATGFKSGGIGQYSTLRPDLNIFDPETLTAYTLGSKNRFFNNRFQANVEAFYWDYRDQQLAVLLPRIENPATIGQQVLNVGKARFYGLDTEFELAATPDDMLSLNIQYLNSEYLEFTYEVAVPTAVGAPRIACTNTQLTTTTPRLFSVDCSGKPAVNAPEWSITGGYEHTFHLPYDLQLVGALRSQYQSSRYMAAEYQPQEKQKAYINSDASLALESDSGSWSLTAWVNNIEDAEIRNQVFQRTIQGSNSPEGAQVVYYTGLRAPRTYGLRAGFKF